MLHEFSEGKYWIDNDMDVYISKEFGKGIDEIDVRIEQAKAIVECKRVSGGEPQVRQNIRNIIDKFTLNTKLTSEMKNAYPNFYGTIRIDGGGVYKTLGKTDFINEIRKSGAIGVVDGAIFSLDDLKKIKELNIINDKGIFTIYETDW